MQRFRRGVDGDDLFGTLRQVESKRSVIAKAVQSSAARSRSGCDAKLALIEECSCFLTVPRRRQIPDSVFIDLHLTWDIAGEKLNARRESFLDAEGHIVSGKDA